MSGSGMKLYWHPQSGHSHRVKLFLSILGVTHQSIEVDLRSGDQHRGWFQRLNPLGQIPVLDDDGCIVADSNAILVYLAKKYSRTDWLPEKPVEAASVQRWLSISAGELVRGPTAARLRTVWNEEAGITDPVARSHAFLAFLESHLAENRWVANDRPSIADVALYAYVAHAPEGGVDLSPYANVGAWLDRMRALEGFVPMISWNP